MNGLDFPAVSPVIFTIGPLAVRWYSMAYLFGILIGWFLLTRNVRKNALALTKENIEDLVFYITLGVILGGRLGYVLFYGQETYLRHPLQIFAVWHGGMSFHGGYSGIVVFFAQNQISVFGADRFGGSVCADRHFSRTAGQLCQ